MQEFFVDEAEKLSRESQPARAALRQRQAKQPLSHGPVLQECRATPVAILQCNADGCVV